MSPTVARFNAWWIDNGGGACAGARYDAALMAYHAGLRDAADENERLREALTRARRWGGMGDGSWCSAVTIQLADWIDAGMPDPLPPLPDHLQRIADKEQG